MYDTDTPTEYETLYANVEGSGGVPQGSGGLVPVSTGT